MIRNYFNKQRGEEILPKQNISYISSTQALEVIKQETGVTVTLPTLLSWAEKNNFRRRVGNRWFIDKSALINYLSHKR